MDQDQQAAANATIPWPHAPAHRMTEAGVYIATAATYRKSPLFSDGPRLRAGGTGRRIR